MVRKSKKSLLDDPATAALMKELGISNEPIKDTPPVKKKAVRRRRGKPTKTPNIKSAIEKKKGFTTAIRREWKVLYGTDRLAASAVSGWLRGYGVTMTGDTPELRTEMLMLSNLARFITTDMDKDND